ncbi:deoxyribose-phosphate aldolase [bacterium]|nr:deoxyribose-phosphate aldolase [bacterium]
MKINKYIDHTYLKAFGTEDVIKKLCLEAKEYNFKSVCVNPYYIELAKELLKGSDTLVCTVIGFPLGQNTLETKIYETLDAIKKGADEIDMVINIAALLDKKYDYVLNEIKNIKEACGDKTLKVIIETCYLTDEEIKIATELVIKAKADFVKTSTGFGIEGAKVKNVCIMKEISKDIISIKAAGGINSYNDAIEMIKAGANRIGTSHGVEIVKGEKE